MEETSLSSLEREILLLIFDKLPIRYVLRCKTVCKEWLCLISDPLFKSKYNMMINPCSTTLPNQPLHLLLIPPIPLNMDLYIDLDVTAPAMYYEIDGSNHTNTSTTSTTLLVGQPFPLPRDTDARGVEILGCYNGLVALSGDFGDFSLINPCTREEKSISVPVFDRIRHHFSGLCHDPDTNEYKVVVTKYFSNELFLIVSFKDDDDDDNNWKLKTKSEAEVKITCDRQVCDVGTTVQGVPHWMCHDSGSVIHFDGKAEEYRTTQLPNCETGYPACGLGALDGKLTVGLWTNKWEGRCEVWAMEEYGNDDSWRFLFVMSVGKSEPFSLLSWRKDEWVVFMFDKGNGQELMICDVTLQRLRRLQLDMRRITSPFDNRLAFVPTLISPVSH